METFERSARMWMQIPFMFVVLVLLGAMGGTDGFPLTPLAGSHFDSFRVPASAAIQKNAIVKPPLIMGALPALPVGTQEALAVSALVDTVQPFAVRPFWQELLLVYAPGLPWAIVCLFYLFPSVFSVEPKAESDSVETKLKAEIDSVNKDVNSVKRELTTEIDLVKLQLNTRIDYVKKDVNSVKTELTTEIDLVKLKLNTEIDSVKKDVNPVKRELTTEIDIVKLELKAEIDSVKKDVNPVKTELKAEIDSVKKDLKSLERQIDLDQFKAKIHKAFGSPIEIMERHAENHREAVRLQLKILKWQQQNQIIADINLLGAKIDKLADSMGRPIEPTEDQAENHRQAVEMQLEILKWQQQNQKIADTNLLGAKIDKLADSIGGPSELMEDKAVNYRQAMEQNQFLKKYPTLIDDDYDSKKIL